MHGRQRLAQPPVCGFRSPICPPDQARCSVWGGEQPQPNHTAVFVSHAASAVAQRPIQVFRSNKELARAAEEEEADLAATTALPVAQADPQPHNQDRQHIVDPPGSKELPRDIWKDPVTIEYLRNGEFSEMTCNTASEAESQRAIRRAKVYLMKKDQLFRMMPDDGCKIVPEPDEREELVTKLHEECGHFGRRRTTHLVLIDYWWVGLYQQVRDVVSKCEACDRVSRAIFNSQRPELQCQL